MLLLVACKGSANHDSPDLLAASDGGTSVPNIDTVECGAPPQAGNATQFVMQRHVLDTSKFPDALCNNGDPAVIYFRPFEGEANRNKWQINLHGGGSCNSGASCLARWCSCASKTKCPYVEETTNFNRLTMVNDDAPTLDDSGLFRRGDTNKPNPLGDYNQVELIYCSSDLWRGARRDLILEGVNPTTNQPVQYSIHFLGAKILAADLATLRRDGVPALVHTKTGTTMPDLDDAEEIVFTGDSAGGGGVIANLDGMNDDLRKTNTRCQGSACPLRVLGIIDAAVGPNMSTLDFTHSTNPNFTTYEGMLATTSAAAQTLEARDDTSCKTFHATDGKLASCSDLTHLLRHHVTTPFFVRMALLDALVSSNYIDLGVRDPAKPNQVMTPAIFALLLQSELVTFSTLKSSAEEGSAMEKNPGVFAPACTKHDTIHSDPDTFQTTITPSGGAPLPLLTVFDNWRNDAAPSNVLTMSATLADTFCP